MAALRFNLHNHTLHSDGAASARDLAEAAAAAGLTHLGISDHYRSTKLPPEKGLDLPQVADYLEELRSLRARFRERVLILAGIEINFSLVQTDLTFLSRYEPDRNPLNQLDFVLFEYVNDGEWLGLGLEELLKLRPLIHIPMGLAHNDLEKNFGGVIQPETLARILGQAQIFVELCPTRRNSRAAGQGRYLPYYRVGSDFNRRFFAAARSEGVLLSIGCDVHADLNEVGAVADASGFLEDAGLAANAVVAHYWVHEKREARPPAG